jgi:lactobin A/cerein 7B family class IIb bacteriocin
MITNEKATAIAAYFKADDARMNELFAMEPADAAAKMTADGCEVTAEELIELQAELKKMSVTGTELDEAALENVAGGIAPILIAAGLFVGGVGVGIAVNAKW